MFYIPLSAQNVHAHFPLRPDGFPAAAVNPAAKTCQVLESFLIY